MATPDAYREYDFTDAYDDHFDAYDGGDDDVPTECPRCNGPLTWEAADPSVGLREAIYCENDGPDGEWCMWPDQADAV